MHVVCARSGGKAQGCFTKPRGKAHSSTLATTQAGRRAHALVGQQRGGREGRGGRDFPLFILRVMLVNPTRILCPHENDRRISLCLFPKPAFPNCRALHSKYQ